MGKMARHLVCKWEQAAGAVEFPTPRSPAPLERVLKLWARTHAAEKRERRLPRDACIFGGKLGVASTEADYRASLPSTSTDSSRT